LARNGEKVIDRKKSITNAFEFELGQMIEGGVLKGLQEALCTTTATKRSVRFFVTTKLKANVYSPPTK
jgi:hypothetical protein